MREKKRRVPMFLVEEAEAKDHSDNEEFGLKTFDEDRNLKVIVETPKGSRNKYKYDEATRMFECHSTLPLGMVFPFDFGFVPNTRAEDGDPLDVLLLMDEPAFPGSLVRARLVGVLEAKQTTINGPWIRNDRLIAVHTNSLQYSRINTWRDLSKKTRDQIESFFKAYNQAKGKRFAVLKWRGCPTAHQLIRKQLIA